MKKLWHKIKYLFTKQDPTLPKGWRKLEPHEIIELEDRYTKTKCVGMSHMLDSADGFPTVLFWEIDKTVESVTTDETNKVHYTYIRQIS